jgi:hypothetical protein
MNKHLCSINSQLHTGWLSIKPGCFPGTVSEYDLWPHFARGQTAYILLFEHLICCYFKITLIYKQEGLNIDHVFGTE